MDNTFKFNVKMTCSGCSGAISRVLEKAKADGVSSYTVDLDKQEVIVNGTILYEDVLARIKKTGKEVLSGTTVEITIRGSSRNFHISRPRHDLVGPPHPVSHFRPITYGDASSQPAPTYLRHPYSLSEFTTGTGSTLGDHELQFLLQRQQMDTFHHSFWLDNNTRFYAAKEEILSSLPTIATARDKEIALSEFYKQWVLQERELTEKYTKEWRRRNYDLILLAVRVQFRRLSTRLTAFFGR